MAPFDSFEQPAGGVSLATPNTVLQGDCITTMQRMARASVDFILTDPPYITSYRARDGRTVANDDNARWVQPAFREMYRVLKPASFCVSFYGWSRADLFIGAWRAAGFRIVGHIIFRKQYSSSARFLRYQHEQAYLLAKGDVALPARPIADVIDFTYTGNRLHPTQKPIAALQPLIETFSPFGGLVLDPFCGSGSTLVAARSVGRNYIGIELNQDHQRTAARRLGRPQMAATKKVVGRP